MEVRLRPEVRRGSPAEAVVAAEVGGGTPLDAISIDDRDALDDLVKSIKSGDRLTRLGCFVIVAVVVTAADGSCKIDEVATSAEEDDDDGGQTSSSLAAGRIAVYKLSMMMMLGGCGVFTYMDKPIGASPRRVIHS